LVVVVAGGDGEVVQSLDLVSGELDIVGCDVLFGTRHPLGSGDRGDVVAFGQEPCDGNLRGCCAGLLCDASDLVGDAEIALEVLAGESRIGPPPVGSSRSSMEWIVPVRNPCPNGEYGTKPMPRLMRQRSTF
jgi:hypothetical protein